MKNDYIMSIKYTFMEHGSLIVTFAPVQDSQISGNNYDFSDDEAEKTTAKDNSDNLSGDSISEDIEKEGKKKSKKRNK